MTSAGFAAVLCSALAVLGGLSWTGAGSSVPQRDLTKAKRLFDDRWWDDAQRILENLASDRSADPEVYYQLAYVYVAKLDNGQWGDQGRMEECAKNAVEPDPANLEARGSLIEVKKARELNPSHKESKQQLKEIKKKRSRGR